MGIYMVLLFASTYAVQMPMFAWRPLRIVVTLLPVLPLFGVLGVSMRKYRESDELQRKIQAEGIIFGFGLTAIVTLTYGFLQANADAPAISYVWVWPLLAVGWVIGMLIARRRYS